MNKIIALVSMITLISFLIILFTSMKESKAPETLYFLDDSKFMCSPEMVKFGDKIVLKKENSKLSELAVYREGADTSHFIVVSFPPDEMTNLVQPNELAAKNTLVLNTKNLTGLEWRSGAKQELIFTKSGKYTFFISPTLESEVGGYKCVIDYLHN